MDLVSRDGLWRWNGEGEVALQPCGLRHDIECGMMHVSGARDRGLRIDLVGVDTVQPGQWHVEKSEYNMLQGRLRF